MIGKKSAISSHITGVVTINSSFSSNDASSASGPSALCSDDVKFEKTNMHYKQELNEKIYMDAR